VACFTAISELLPLLVMLVLLSVMAAVLSALHHSLLPCWTLLAGVR
jgi:hypothetical protein